MPRRKDRPLFGERRSSTPLRSRKVFGLDWDPAILVGVEGISSIERAEVHYWVKRYSITRGARSTHHTVRLAGA